VYRTGHRVQVGIWLPMTPIDEIEGYKVQCTYVGQMQIIPSYYNPLT